MTLIAHGNDKIGEKQQMASIFIQKLKLIKHPQGKCQFLALSREIRDIIYGMVLVVIAKPGINCSNCLSRC